MYFDLDKIFCDLRENEGNVRNKLERLKLWAAARQTIIKTPHSKAEKRRCRKKTKPFRGRGVKMKKDFNALKCKDYFKTDLARKTRPFVTSAGLVRRLTGRLHLSNELDSTE